MAGYFSPYDNVRNEQVAVGVSAVTVADNRKTGMYDESGNNVRKVLSIRNISPNAADIITVWLSSTGVATANSGIVLRQYESFTDSQDSGYMPWQDKVTAICATANGILTVFER